MQELEINQDPFKYRNKKGSGLEIWDLHEMGIIIYSLEWWVLLSILMASLHQFQTRGCKKDISKERDICISQGRRMK